MEEFIRNAANEMIITNHLEIFEPSINQERLSEIIQRFLQMPIRENPSCTCTDEYCPHKQPISPLYLFSLQDSLISCIEFNKKFVQAFNPKMYKINTIDTYKNIPKNTDNTLYVRYQTKLLLSKFEVPTNFDIFEGFLFYQNDLRHSDPLIMKINFNGSKKRFVIKDNFLPNEFILPLPSMGYTKIIIKLNRPVYCHMVFGSINTFMFKKLPYMDHEINLKYNNDEQPVIILNGMAGWALSS